MCAFGNAHLCLQAYEESVQQDAFKEETRKRAQREAEDAERKAVEEVCVSFYVD